MITFTKHINMSVVTILTSGKTQCPIKKIKKLVHANYKTTDVLYCYSELKSIFKTTYVFILGLPLPTTDQKNK